MSRPMLHPHPRYHRCGCPMFTGIKEFFGKELAGTDVCPNCKSISTPPTLSITSERLVLRSMSLKDAELFDKARRLGLISNLLSALEK